VPANGFTRKTSLGHHRVVWTDREPPGQSVREGPAGDAGPSAYDAAAQSEQSV